MVKLHTKIKQDKNFASEYFVNPKGTHVNYVVTKDGRLMKVTESGEHLVAYKEKIGKKRVLNK